MTVSWSMTKHVWKWRRYIVSSLCCVRGNRFNADSTSCSYISSWLTYSRPRIGFNLRFHNLPWGLAFDYNEEYPGEAERRLSLVKSEMEEEGVDAAVEARWLRSRMNFPTSCLFREAFTHPFTRFHPWNTLRFHLHFANELEQFVTWMIH